MLFALYVAGVASAMGVAYVLKRSGAITRFQALMLELPAYHWPNLRNLAIGLWQRVEIFLSRVGTIILALDGHPMGAVLVPGSAAGRHRARPSSTASPGTLGAWLAVLFAPIGFNWQISIALVPGLAAREVAVGALGTVYALVGDRHRHERRVDAADRAVLEPADGAVAARLVRVRAAMPVDAGHREARNEFLALSHHHGGLSVCAGLCGIVDYLSNCPDVLWLTRCNP